MTDFQNKWLKANSEFCLESSLVNIFVHCIFRYTLLVLICLYFYYQDNQEFFVIYSNVFLLFTAMSFVLFLLSAGYSIEFCAFYFYLIDTMEVRDITNTRRYLEYWKDAIVYMNKHQIGWFGNMFYCVEFSLLGYIIALNKIYSLLSVSAIILSASFAIFFITNAFAFKYARKYVKNHITPILIAMVEGKIYHDEIKKV